jgi:hypothetical protein
MHHVIAWPIIVASAALLAGCADLIGPTPRGVGDPTFTAELARRPKQPVSPPDSVHIDPPFPPIPIEPIPIELPLIVDTAR